MFFFFQAEDGIRDHCVTGVQTCALPILFSFCQLVFFESFQLTERKYALVMSEGICLCRNKDFTDIQCAFNNLCSSKCLDNTNEYCGGSYNMMSVFSISYGKKITSIYIMCLA